MGPARPRPDDDAILDPPFPMTDDRRGDTLASPPDLEPELLRRLAPWRRRAVEMIDGLVDDAAAHASRAVRRTSPTAAPRAVVRRPEFKRASERLDRLRRDALALVADARERFYRDAFGLLAPHLDPAWFHVDARPTEAGGWVARTAVVNGYAPADELAGTFGESQRGLAAAASLTGRRDDDDRPIDAWSDRTKRAILAAVGASLTDSQIAMLNGVMASLEK